MGKRKLKIPLDPQLKKVIHEACKTKEGAISLLKVLLPSERKSKPKFPPLVKGSEVDLFFAEYCLKHLGGSFGNTSNLRWVKYICALAAAEHRDVEFRSNLSRYKPCRNYANEWDAFRREHCKSDGRKEGGE